MDVDGFCGGSRSDRGGMRDRMNLLACHAGCSLPALLEKVWMSLETDPRVEHPRSRSPHSPPEVGDAAVVARRVMEAAAVAEDHRGPWMVCTDAYIAPAAAVGVADGVAPRLVVAANTPAAAAAAAG